MLFQKLSDLFKPNPEIIDTGALLDDFVLEVKGYDHELTLTYDEFDKKLVYKVEAMAGKKIKHSLPLRDNDTKQSIQARHDKVIEWFVKQVNAEANLQRVVDQVDY